MNVKTIRGVRAITNLEGYKELEIWHPSVLLERGVNMLNKPYVSPEFTVEDIHRIREYHVEITSEMTDEEKMRYYNQGASKFLQEISESWKDSNAERELQK